MTDQSDDGSHESGDTHRPRMTRPRLALADLTQERGARVRVRVVLEAGDTEHSAERAGVGGDTMILRLAAEATLAALHSVIGESDYFELVGVKRIHAFDEYVILTGVRLVHEPFRRLLGCVPLRQRNLVEGTASSLLNATNRIVEWLPERESDTEQTSESC